jgi:hypothetical protein
VLLLRNRHCERFSAKQSLTCEKIASSRPKRGTRDDKWFLEFSQKAGMNKFGLFVLAFFMD